MVPFLGAIVLAASIVVQGCEIIPRNCSGYKSAPSRNCQASYLKFLDKHHDLATLWITEQRTHCTLDVIVDFENFGKCPGNPYIYFALPKQPIAYFLRMELDESVRGSCLFRKVDENSSTCDDDDIRTTWTSCNLAKGELKNLGTFFTSGSYFAFKLTDPKYHLDGKVFTSNIESPRTFLYPMLKFPAFAKYKHNTSSLII